MKFVRIPRSHQHKVAMVEQELDNDPEAVIGLEVQSSPQGHAISIMLITGHTVVQQYLTRGEVMEVRNLRKVGREGN